MGGLTRVVVLFAEGDMRGSNALRPEIMHI